MNVRFGTLVLGLASALAFCGNANAQTKVVGGIAAYNEALLPVYVAEQKGYFKDAGIQLELNNFKGGGPTVQALVSGSIQICFCAADHVVRLRSRRQPAVILAGLDTFHSYALVAKASTPYSDLASMKGKKIGITSPGSLTDNTLRYSINELKLSPERDFQIVGAGTGAAMRAAIDSSQVDAGLVILTEIAALMKEPNAYKIVLDYRETPYPSYAALALESWVKDNPAVAKGLTRALGKAIADVEKDPELARKTIAKMYPNFSPELVAEVAKSAVERMPKGGHVTTESIKNLNGILTSADPSLKPVTLQEAFDPALLAN